MRLLATLLYHMRRVSNEKLVSMDILDGALFYKILLPAIKKLTETEVQTKHGLRVQLGFQLKKFIKVVKGHLMSDIAQYEKEEEMEKKSQTKKRLAGVQIFSGILDLQGWRVLGASKNEIDQRATQIRKPEDLPLEKDVQMLYHLLRQDIKEISEDE